METCRSYFRSKLTNVAKITCQLGFIFYLLNFSTIDSALGQVMETQEKQVRQGIADRVFEKINPMMKIDEKCLLKASNLAFVDEIRKNSKSGRIRYGEVEAAARGYNISTKEACESCGIKYKETPDKSSENVAKRDFWRRVRFLGG